MIPVGHLAMLVLTSKARIDIVNFLARRSMSLKEIALLLAMEKGAVRYHLKVLQEANFVRRYEIGGGSEKPEAFYTLFVSPSTRALLGANLLEKASLSLVTGPVAGWLTTSRGGPSPRSPSTWHTDSFSGRPMPSTKVGQARTARRRMRERRISGLCPGQ